MIKGVTEFPRGRKHPASRCRECVAKYAKSYRQRPEVKAGSRAYSKAYRANPAKADMLRQNWARHRRKPSVKIRKNAARRAWVAAEKQKCVNYKGGACQICGYNKCLAALDFHHKNPAEKNGYGTGALKAHWTFEKNKPELDKCILVCVRCHREIHAGITIL